MSRKDGSVLGRLAAEALAIGLGVVLALAADDWRETRSDRREARESLGVVLEDLRADSSLFARAGRATARHTSAAAWILESWDRAAPPTDSIEEAFYAFSSGARVLMSRSAYDGLEASNHLRLLESDSVRAGLLDYYQERQGTLATYDDLFWTEGLELLDLLAPYVRNPGGRDRGSVWPPSADKVELRTDWGTIAADARLHHQIVVTGRYVDFLNDLLVSAEAEASRLIDLLHGELGGS
ncbi:MAG: hypothetical protein HKN72_02535 [Gemmatimonadetes bacterium]|nr:hypothetical protein [Gemmatimonadota bacterium]